MNRRAGTLTLIALMTSFLPMGLCAADSTFTDLQISGQLGVGTDIPRARLDLQMSSDDLYGLKIDDPAGKPVFIVDKWGRTGLGLSDPEARLDVRGGLLLRSGGGGLDAGGNQILFSAGSSPLSQFSIRSRHSRDSGSGNALDFYFSRNMNRWKAQQNIRALSLAGSDAADRCSVGVSPVGTTAFELDVSSGGGVPGGGTMRYGSAGEPATKALFSGLKYLGSGDAAKAYADVKALRHAKFRYKTLAASGYIDTPASPPVLGLVYEDTPDSIRGRDKTIVEDYRVANLELALKEINRKIVEVEAKIAAAEKK